MFSGNVNLTENQYTPSAAAFCRS